MVKYLKCQTCGAPIHNTLGLCDGCASYPDEANFPSDLVIITLKGGEILAPDQARVALDMAMQIISAVGTTGIHSQCANAKLWMELYYPNFS